MTYIPEPHIEARAAELWRTHHLEPGFDVEALIDQLGLSLLWDEFPDPEGTKAFGALKPHLAQVILNERHLADLESNVGLRRFTLAHEIGHWILHAEAARSGTLSIMVGDRIWCRDRSQHPIERQAELFASHLLMPTDRLRTALPKTPWQGWTPIYALAQLFAVSPTAMIVRLERAGWAHRDDTKKPSSGPAAITGQTALDLS